MAFPHPDQIPAPLVPRIAREWKPLFIPKSSGCYINDHCILKGPDGAWHLFGITGTSELPNPEQERWFAHGQGSSSLWSDKPMHELDVVCNDGTRAWAPGVIGHDGRYFMFYGPSPTKLAVSRDLKHWMREDVVLAGAPLEACHRDHMVMQLEESTWLLYATGLDKAGMGVISIYISNDLRNWRFVRSALRTTGKAALSPAWGATESPFVFLHQGWYYLSITYTDCNPANYQQTLIFRSLNPFDFGVFDADHPEQSVVQRLQAHAPEYLYDEKERSWHITTCGWRGFGLPHEGGVSIARLEWDAA